jgi:hypothetical protein
MLEYCGDGMLNGAEVCDGTDLGGQDCVSLGYGAGTAVCNAACDAIDVSGCGPGPSCGNDLIEGVEVCDGTDLGGDDCTDHGFYGGTLGCLANCTGLDTSGCAGRCGDGITNGPEVCDGTDVGGLTCAGLGYVGGDVSCNATCDATSASTCFAGWTIGWCNVQWPQTHTGAAGTTETIYGQVYIAGLTDVTPNGPDPDPFLMVEVGVGPDGSDPSVDASWVWYPTAINPFGILLSPDNDEYMGDITLPPAGSYDYAFRFSGDLGQSWTYCDRDLNPPHWPTYDATDAGQLTTH